MTPAPCAFIPEAVLFDCDGTLLLSADLHYLAMSRAAGLQGHAMSRDWYMALTGLGREDTFARLASEFGIALDQGALVRDSICMTVALADQVQINTPVAALAQRLAGVLPIAVVTNSEAPIASAFLRAAGLMDLFQTLVTVEDAALPKPAPDLYLVAARRLGVSASRCLVLEDSAQGIEAAQRAGARCLDVRAPGWQAQAQVLLAACAPALNAPG